MQTPSLRMYFWKKVPLLCLFCSFILLGACGGSSPTSFYMLESKTLSPVKELSSVDKSKLPKVILQEVQVPAYLDRTNITTRRADGVSLEISEFNSWSEDLTDGVRRVLSDVLMPSLLKENVLLLSIDDDQADARKIFVFIQRFDGELQGKITLDARWTVHTYDNEELVSGAFVESAAAGPDYTSLVQAQSALIIQLAKSMSQPISNALQGKR